MPRSRNPSIPRVELSPPTITRTNQTVPAHGAPPQGIQASPEASHPVTRDEVRQMMRAMENKLLAEIQRRTPSPQPTPPVAVAKEWNPTIPARIPPTREERGKFIPTMPAQSPSAACPPVTTDNLPLSGFRPKNVGESSLRPTSQARAHPEGSHLLTREEVTQIVAQMMTTFMTKVWKRFPPPPSNTAPTRGNDPPASRLPSDHCQASAPANKDRSKSPNNDSNKRRRISNNGGPVIN